MFHILGWATVVSIGLTTVGTLRVIWLSLARPWIFRPRVRVPREVDDLEWVVPAQDNPIPWI